MSARRRYEHDPRVRFSDFDQQAVSGRGVCRHCGRKGRFYPLMPAGYVAASEWAERKMRTHHQEPCPGCGRLSVWKRGPASPAPS